MQAEITTDGDGNATARITQAGTGYVNGDFVLFQLSGGRTVVVKVTNAADSAIISTQKVGGNAGDILFGFKDGNSTYGGQEIYLSPNAKLLAEADVSASLKARQDYAGGHGHCLPRRKLAGRLHKRVRSSRSMVPPSRAVRISITAKATDTNAANEEDVPAFLRGFVGNLTNLLNQIPGALISAFTGIDVSVVMRGADAKIHVYDATIVSAGSVDISATTKVDTQVYAVAMGVAGLATNSGFEFAAGCGLAESIVDVTISGSTTISGGR